MSINRYIGLIYKNLSMLDYRPNLFIKNVSLDLLYVNIMISCVISKNKSK